MATMTFGSGPFISQRYVRGHSRRPSWTLAAGFRMGRKHALRPVVTYSKPDQKDHEDELKRLEKFLVRRALRRKAMEKVLENMRKELGHELTPQDLLRADKQDHKNEGVEDSSPKWESTKEMEKMLENMCEEVRHDLPPDIYEKLFMQASAHFGGFVLVKTLLIAGAASGAFFVAGLLGESAETYGAAARVLQVLAFILGGYYSVGVVLGVIKLGVIVAVSQNFKNKPEAFLRFLESGRGRRRPLPPWVSLGKARGAVNLLKVLQALMRISDLLQKEQPGAGSGPDMLRDLGAYLTLEKAQRAFGFDAHAMGLTDDQAVGIAVVYAKHDADGDGVLGFYDFKRLCAEYAPELNEAEVQAGFDLLDINKDAQVGFKQFVNWWMKKLQLPDAFAERNAAPAGRR